MLIYAKNKHPRSNHLGEMNQKPKKEILTLSHPCVAVTGNRFSLATWDFAYEFRLLTI